MGKVGSGGRIRTYDQRINSPLRYRCATPEYAIPFEEALNFSFLNAAAVSGDRSVGEVGGI